MSFFETQCSISLPSLRQHYLVNKLENKVQIHHRHVKHFHVVTIAKIGLVHPEIFDEICRTTAWTRNAMSIRLFSAKTARLIFTKILHDIVALVALLNHAYTRRYAIPFLNARVTNVRSFAIFCTKLVAMVTSLEISEKEVQIDHLHTTHFHLVKRLRKLVQRILR